MIAFPGMLVSAAEKAGMGVPEDPDNFENVSEQYPHFYVYCLCQLARPVFHGEHWENAKVIAALSEEEIKEITLEQLQEKGFCFGPQGLDPYFEDPDPDAS